MVLDIKVEDLRYKAKLVTGGHMTAAPATIMYAWVVSRETVRIALMIAVLNDLEKKLSDIFNAYVQAPLTDNVWTTLHPESSNNGIRLQWLLEHYMAFYQQEQVLEATLLDAWNPWDIFLVWPTCIYGWDQKPDQKMGIELFLSTILCIHHMQMLCFT